MTEAGLLIGRVIKRYSGQRLLETVRRAGSAETIGEVLRRKHTGRQINTSYSERLNATFRANPCGVGERCCTRRGRCK